MRRLCVNPYRRANDEPERQGDTRSAEILEDDVARTLGRDLQCAARPGRHPAAAALGLHAAFRAAATTAAEGVTEFGGRYDRALADWSSTAFSATLAESAVEMRRSRAPNSGKVAAFHRVTGP